MRFSGTLIVAAVVLWFGPAHAQISYVSRDTYIGYYEEDFDLLTSQVTYSDSDAAGTMTFGTFNSFVATPGQSSLFDDSAAAQYSALFSDAIDFDLAAYAEEDRTDNSFGVYTAGALSRLTVVFDIATPIDFTLAGAGYDDEGNADSSGASLSLTGPGVNLSASSAPYNLSGMFEAGRYTLDLAAESMGYYEDGFLGIDRQRGTFLNFDGLLLLGGIQVIAGDYNASGQVEQGDLDLVLQNWGLDTDTAGVPAGWTGGDQPMGQIEQTELDGVLSNWGSTAAPDFTGSSVPEPTTAAALLALTTLRRRLNVMR